MPLGWRVHAAAHAHVGVRVHAAHVAAHTRHIGVHVARGSIVFPFDFTGLAEQYRLVDKARRFTVQIITSSPD